MMNYNHYLKLLIKQRKSNGISSRALADVIGVSETLVDKWEGQKTIPNVVNFLNWCEALAIEVNISQAKKLTREWQPNEKTWEYIYETYQREFIEDDTQKFYEHYISNGQTREDWNECFRKWHRTAKQFRRERTGNNRYMDKTNSEFIEMRRDKIRSLSDFRSNKKGLEDNS